MDMRYCYSTCCTWHGPIQDVRVCNGLPGCPYCDSPLYEYDNRAEWDSKASEFAIQNGLLRYPEWLESLRHQPCRLLAGWNWLADLEQWLSCNPVGPSHIPVGD